MTLIGLGMILNAHHKKLMPIKNANLFDEEILKINFYKMKKYIILVLILAIFFSVIPVFGATYNFPPPVKGIKTITDLVSALANFLYNVAISICAIIIVYAGFLFITSAGNQQKVQTAQKALTWALIGLAVVLIAGFVPDIIKGILYGSAEPSNVEESASNVVLTEEEKQDLITPSAVDEESDTGVTEGENEGGDNTGSAVDEESSGNPSVDEESGTEVTEDESGEGDDTGVEDEAVAEDLESKCDQCGSGFWNICGKEECESLGNCIYWIV